MYPEEDNRNITNSANTASGSYSAILPSPNVDIASSINSSIIPLPLSEELLAGQRLNGRMSSIRRFFCLFITFDLLFTSLMWLICVMLNGDSIWIAIDKEIYHYNVHTSLFDITLAAICRFTVLLLFYGLCHINHWLIISLSTAGTCAFLISKVFVFNWQDSPQPVFQVLLILTSFVLAWGEAWFLDFRVIPQESRANQFFISTTTPDTERTPLIRSYVQGLPSTYAYTNTESIANFYSPQGSPSGSIHRFGEQSSRSTTHLTQDQVDFYKNLGTKTVIEAAELVKNVDWKILKQNEDDDVVSVLGLPNTNRKIYKLTALVKARPRYLLDELFDRVEQMPNWNPALAESNRLDVIDDCTDITYQISATAARGVINSRDFVNLRCWQIKDGRYIIGSVGIEDHHLMPETEIYTRGRNGIGCWSIDPVENNPEQCYLEWIINTDLKLKLNAWLTGPFLEKAYINLLFDFARDLRAHLKKCDDRL